MLYVFFIFFPTNHIFIFFSSFQNMILHRLAVCRQHQRRLLRARGWRAFLGIFMKQRGEIKIYFFLIQALFELKKFRYLFLPSLCTTSPVAVFRFWVTSSICLKSKPPGLLFFFCFYTECQAFGLWMTCALVLELYG